MMKEWGDPLFCLLIRIKRKSRPLGRERVKRMSPAPKKKGNVAQRVWELSEPLAKELNLSLWDVQFVKEGADWFLRVFIDKEGGVSIDDCEAVSRPLSDLLDEADPIPEGYIFEVSSAGLDRVLRKPEHFEKCLGQQVDVKLYRPQAGSKEYTGALTGYQDGDVLVDDRRFEKKDVAQVRLHVSF